MSKPSDDVTSDREFLITRTINAPRSLVFQAWTDPKHLARWWGPRSFTNPVCEVDLRVGGAHRLVMRSPEGINYPITGIFLEIVEPERLVMTLDPSEHPTEWHDLVKPNRSKTEANPAGIMVQTVTIEDFRGMTKLTIRTRFDSTAIRDAMLKLGMTEGWSQSLDRLVAVVQQLDSKTDGKSSATKSSSIPVRVERQFESAAEQVFDAWLDRENIGKWLFATPNGEMVKVEVDPRVGGQFTIIEKRGELLAEHFGTYVTIDRPRKLVFGFRTDTSSDPTVVTIEITPTANGCKLVLSHEMSAEWADFVGRAREGWTMILEGLSSTVRPPRD